MAGRALKVHCESEGEREAWMRELRQVGSSSLSLCDMYRSIVLLVEIDR